MVLRYSLIGLLLVMTGCSADSKKQSTLQTPVALSSTFWQGFEYADKERLEDTLSLHKAFHAWLEMFEGVSESDAKASLGKLIVDGNEHPEMQHLLMLIGERFLNNPNSPFRNEELYIPMLEAMIEAPSISEENKFRYRFQYNTAMKNRRGTQANDFRYITSQKKKGNLYQLEHEYILLYFFNPECHDCARVKAYMEASSIIGKMQQEGRLQVLAVYPDEDLVAWNRHADKNPKEWITARYVSQKEAEAFYLPAIPNLYLLDKDKMVLLKDAPIELIEAVLFSPF